MSTELQQQLSKLREINVISTQIHSGAPSLFLEAKEASKIDISEVYASAMRGFEVLRQFDKRLLIFLDTIFHDSSISLQRELKTPKENEALNRELSSLFSALSAYASVPSMHLILEYLIRRYRVHEYNAHDLILCMITQHDTKLFARVVQLSSISNTKWAFLNGVKASGMPIDRTALVRQCLKDNSLLECLCALIEKVVSSYLGDSQLSPLSKAGVDAALSFFTAVILELIGLRSLSDVQLRTLYPSIVSGINCVKPGAVSKQWRQTQILIVSNICESLQMSVTLSSSIVVGIAKALKNCQEDSSHFQVVRLELVFLLCVVANSQELSLSLFTDALDHLLPFESKITTASDIHLFSTMQQLSGSIDVTSWTSLLINSLTRRMLSKPYKGDSLHCAHFISYLISSKLVSNHNVKACLHDIFAQADHIFAAGTASKLYTSISSILQLLSQLYPIDFDSIVSSEVDVTREAPRALISGISINVQYQFADNGTSLYVSLQSSSALIRLEALQSYIALAKSIDGMSSTSGSAQTILSLATAASSLLCDTDAKIARLAWAEDSMKCILQVVPRQDMINTMKRSLEYWLGYISQSLQHSCEVLSSFISSVSEEWFASFLINNSGDSDDDDLRSWLLMSVTRCCYTVYSMKGNNAVEATKQLNSSLNVFFSSLNTYYPTIKPKKLFSKTSDLAYLNLVHFLTSDFEAGVLLLSSLVDQLTFTTSSLHNILLADYTVILSLLGDTAASLLSFEQTEFKCRVLKLKVTLAMQFLCIHTETENSKERKDYLMKCILSGLNSLAESDSSVVLGSDEGDLLSLLNSFSIRTVDEATIAPRIIEYLLSSTSDELAGMVGSAISGFSTVPPVHILTQIVLCPDREHVSNLNDIIKNISSGGSHAIETSLTSSTLAKARGLYALSLFLKSIDKQCSIPSSTSTVVLISCMLMLVHMCDAAEALRYGAIEIANALAEFGTCSLKTLLTTSSCTVSVNVVAMLGTIVAHGSSAILQDLSYALAMLRSCLENDETLGAACVSLKWSPKLCQETKQLAKLYLANMAQLLAWEYPVMSAVCLQLLTGQEEDSGSVHVVMSLLSLPSSCNDSAMMFERRKSLIHSLMGYLSSLVVRDVKNNSKIALKAIQIISAQCMWSDSPMSKLLALLKDNVIALLGRGWLVTFDDQSQALLYKETMSELVRSSGKDSILLALEHMHVKLNTLLEILTQNLHDLSTSLEVPGRLEVEELTEEKNGSNESNAAVPLQNVTLILEALLQSFPNIVMESPLDYGKVAIVLFDLLHLMNRKKFHSVLLAGYSQSIVLDILAKCFVSCGATFIQSGTSTKAKPSKKIAANTIEVNDGYSFQRLNLDVEQIIICLQNSTSSQTRVSALGLLQILSPLAPDSILASITVLGKLISAMVVRKGADITPGRLEKTDNDKGKSIVELLRIFLAVIQNARTAAHQNAPDCTHQHISQAFFKHFWRFVGSGRAALINVALEALGDDCIVPCVLSLFAHSMSLFTAQSGSEIVDSSLVLLSKNAKKKAQRSLKVSASEEVFQLIIDFSLRSSPKALMIALVALVKCCQVLLDLLSDSQFDSVVSFKSSIASERICGFDVSLCLQYIAEILKDTITQGKVQKDIRGYASSLVLVVLEFVYDLMESKIFHSKLVRAMDKAIDGEDFQSEFLEFSEQCLQLLSNASSLTVVKKFDASNGQFEVRIGCFVTNISGASITKTIRSWCLQLLQSAQRLIDAPTFVAILQELLDHDDLAVRQKALIILGERLEHINNGSKGNFAQKSLFLDLLIHLRSSIADASKRLVDVKSKNVSTAQINLVQSSIMCVDTLARCLGKGKGWQDVLFESLKENTSLASTVHALSKKSPSGHELMKLLGTIYLCCSTHCASLGARSLPLFSSLMPAMLDSLEYYNSIVSNETDGPVTKGRLLLIRSIVSAIASMIFELPSFSHPYLIKVLRVTMEVYRRQSEQLSRPEVELMKRDVDRCMGVTISSIPGRMLIPALLKGMPELMSLGHTIAHRFSCLLQDVWEGLTRETVVQFMPQLSSMATLALDYRRALGDRSEASDKVDLVSVDSIVELSMKFTEVEMRAFLLRLSEWRDLSEEAVSDEWRTDARGVVFYRLLAKLGVRLKGIFVPTNTMFWDSMRIGLTDFLSANDAGSLRFQTKRSNAKKGTKRKLETGDTSNDVTNLSSCSLQEKLVKAKMVLDCMTNCCIYGSDEFMDETRYESTMPDVVGLIRVRETFERDDEYFSFIENHLSPCINALAVGIGKDIMWKPMNHHILMNTRDSRSAVRLAALKILHKLFIEIGEEYLILIPECLSYLSELLEDDSEEVHVYTAEVIKHIENISGESMEDYLH